jgi:flagellar basal-body rod protein FlgF
MDRGLYIAASGMLAEQIRQDQIANDLANASTPGYKADRTSQRSFNDLLLANSATGQTVGPQSTAVQVDRIVTDFTGRPLRETGEALDFGISGDGFFAVQTEQGVRYTRNGQFTLDTQGRLVTASGAPVLGPNNQPITANADGTAAGAASGTVQSGMLESSGADPARSMVDMISSMRAFEAGQKVIQTIDETLGKAATQVGSVSS